MNSYSVDMRLALLSLLLAFPLTAQQSGWTTPFEGHRIIGNLYYVGTYDLAVFLITSDEGHILINTGAQSSTSMIENSMESLGFKLKDVKILLTMQAHWDHTAALAEIKEMTGAEMWATADDAPVLEDGGVSDRHFGGKESFKPISVSHIINDGDLIELGDIQLKVLETPGHSNGSVSYTMTVNEGGKDYKIGIINMSTINPGKTMTGKPTYTGVAADFAETFLKQRAVDLDVWVSAHASQYNLHKKYKAGQAYSPDTFVDPEGYRKKVAAYEKAFFEQVLSERPR